MTRSPIIVLGNARPAHIPPLEPSKCDTVNCVPLDLIPPDSFDSLLAFTRQHGGPPSLFLKYRRNQLELVLAMTGVELRNKEIVEIGGGVSGQALLLSTLAQRVIVTDLLHVESVHGTAFAEAAAIRRLNRQHLFFVCSRAESLPLPDASADVAFSSYALEHIEERREAVAEINRILRDDGIAIVVVPNVMAAVIRMLWFLLVHAPRQALKVILLRSGLAQRLGMELRYAPDFRYKPHGAYPGHFAELSASRIGEWDDLFRQQGFEIAQRFSLEHESYLAFFSWRLRLASQQRALRMLRAIGPKAAAVWLGPAYGFVAKKGRAQARNQASTMTRSYSST